MLEFVRKSSEHRMQVREKEQVPYLVFPSLEETGLVCHGISIRLGGVSEGIFSSMNVSFTRGDEEQAVRENFRRIGAALGFSCENLVFSDQTHTVNIRRVTEKDRGKGFSVPRDYQNVDGLITDVPELVLTTFYADCVPLLFLDPVHRAIGLSHSGWKGTVGKIGKETLKQMEEAYGTRAADVLAAIGPSICQDCYEVSEDVAEQFRAAFEPESWPKLLREKPNGKYQLDLWKANELILQEAGILPEHLTVTDICTCCNPGLLFSHRASGGRRGNLAAFLALR